MVGASHSPGGVAARSDRTATIKFLCSYGGRILPRYPDGKLRYLGGVTRVLAVDRSIPFSELLLKLEKLCGTCVSLRCQLPSEDLDALVSITSDEDLANLIEEYDRAASPSSLKIRAFLSPPKSVKEFPLPCSSASSSPSSSKPSSPTTAISSPRASTQVPDYCIHQIPTPVRFSYRLKKSPAKVPLFSYHPQGNPSHIYLIHNGNHWQ
ncbi:uncharacterized protein LOC111805002 isoform X2 [Cucurbita pepo subsp. pepo]|uniref:Uncharacterized protein LOC111500016 isoform X1 n=1 Tax=Cucurbita maxima TaxID=3661 RepID=A0A6J1KZ48_CUCMA|nr:uncharacterized protein LOC111500016 isoform X1 [Cucurbita maxima]XP_023007587.1 uncharacterized protein LOC111500016 isoform X1 [Cucurbita maxima]XP_023545628.1 uncharacterized protein LOC111805002 isoform X1 [Cucurbita pepo subsp. pepo]XP_023545636.1 uncharacterized protein LOC111805002 isoform X2 [Cucurbita pepo subsp. pepo]